MKISAENALLDAACENPEIAPFAYFELDLSQTVDPTTGGLAFPELEGKHTPLWNITSNGGYDAQREARQARLAEEEARAARIMEMRKRVENGQSALPPAEGSDDAEDEWTTFWGGASPTQRGWV